MLAALIAAAFALGLAVRACGLPPLVGFLAAGFALRAAGVEPMQGMAEVAHLGVLLLLFTVGLKVRLQNVLRPEVWCGAVLHLAISAAFFGLLGYLFLGLDWPAALLLGTALGFSSTVVAAKILEDKRELRAFHGRVSIGILIVQDLVAVALLSVLGGHSPSPWALLVFALPLLQPLVNRLLEYTGHGELLLLLGLVLALDAGALGFEAVGLSPELGALLMGALLAGNPRANELGKALWGIKEFFLVAFFLQIGLSGLPDLPALAVAVSLALLLPLKAALFMVILLAFGLRARSSFLTGLSLASYSEFGLIVAQLAVEKGLLGSEWVVYLALIVALSFAIAAPVNRAAHGLFVLLERHLRPLERDRSHPDDAPISLGSAKILILGMGRVGTGAYDFLKTRDERVVGLDSDPAKVQRHLGEGRRVLYADAEDSGFWQRLHLDGVRAVLLAMPDLEAKVMASTQLRARGYAGLISATNVYPEEAQAILDSGCSTTFNYFDEAGVGFAEHTWEALYPGEAPPTGHG